MKKIVITISAAIALSTSLSACGEPSKSVQYFESHEAEIAPTIARCAKAPGVKNCDEAGDAQSNLRARRHMAERQRRAEEDKRRFMEFFAVPKK